MRYGYHLALLHFEDGVATDVAHLPPPLHEDHVVGLQELDEACRRVQGRAGQGSAGQGSVV